jgi:hypothetical protein
MNVRKLFNFVVIFILTLFSKISLSYAKGPPFDPPGPPPDGFPHGVSEPTTLALLGALIVGGIIARKIIKHK